MTTQPQAEGTGAAEPQPVVRNTTGGLSPGWQRARERAQGRVNTPGSSLGDTVEATDDEEGDPPAPPPPHQQGGSSGSRLGRGSGRRPTPVPTPSETPTPRLRGTFYREEREAQEEARRSGRGEARIPPGSWGLGPDQWGPEWDPLRKFLESLASLGHTGRDPKITFRNAPETFAEFVTWKGHIRSTLLTAGTDALVTIQYLKELDDVEGVTVDQMMTDRSREVISLDVRFFQGLQASLQHGPSALRHSREIDRTHTFENGLLGINQRPRRLFMH